MNTSLETQMSGASIDPTLDAYSINSLNAEKHLFQRARSLMDDLRRSHPEYFAFMEDADPMLATREDLRRLMERAPNDSVFMYVFANFSVRLQLAAITGREFV